MVKSELIYNPYLGETSIKFNGQSPKINSLVEKYQGEILNDWIDKIPSIFHDEMNGYGFELDFSGTQLDYQNLQRSFASQGISNSDVPIFFKNELESRSVKVERIEKLLEWLRVNPNHNFDYDSFKTVNSGLLDDLYIYKILQGKNIDAESLKAEDISVELLEDVHELDLTNLTNVPILIYVSNLTVDNLAENTKYLLKRYDVKSNQFFFYIDKSCNAEVIKRTIIDLGINNPQIVSAIYDESIKTYFEIYPITDYIRQTIQVMRALTNDIQCELDKQARDNQISERNANTAVFKSDNKIKELKNLDEMFENRDNIDLPISFLEAQREMTNKINNWRNKKTVITNDGEASIAAQEFEILFKSAYETFWNGINIALIRSEEDIKNKYQAMYSSGGIDPNYIPKVESTKKISSYSVPDIHDKLLNIKDEKYVLPKEGIIDQVFRTNSSNKFMERVTTYYYKDWREFVLKFASEMAEKEINHRFSLLKQYSDDLSNAFHAHITNLLAEEVKNKNAEMNHLSESEKLLQLDTDWLNAVVEQLAVIERG